MTEPMGHAIDTKGLRERNIPQHVPTAERAKKVVEELNAEEEETLEAEKNKKTFGRTPNGTVFTVPHTRDMVSQLLSPSEPKNISDCIVLAILALHILVLYLLQPAKRVRVFAVIFLFWRACYNVGIGYLLQIQSLHRRLVRLAEKSKIFKDPASGENPHPLLYRFLKRELETKVPEDYHFEEAPIEYNTWLVFRRIVDLILMCDFVSYCLFAIACGGRPADETIAMTVIRWTTGIGLVVFNLWVKLDAHRVVKDFAWYWGDFFYLIDQDLTFDGVFEMAPHPMYSVGYAGYYGISMMAASYKVLFISIVAHAAQFAFLVLVESPHIEKTYNAPPPRKRLAEAESSREANGHPTNDGEVLITFTEQPASVHNLLGLHNIDLYRITDSSVILLQLLLLSLTVLTPSNDFHQSLFIANAFIWRLWYSVGIGYLLDRQSNKRKWTRHFVKYGDSNDEAWRQWKGTYHLSMTMCYASFVAACWKVYSPPPDWEHGLVLLKHVLGASLIALQIWTVISIYESLGEFGWFFGDFFFDQSSKLTYSGIYRFLNNPERIIGLAGVWGAVLITESKAIFLLALLSHVLTLGFIHFVERPHMQKLYGRSLRQDSGLVRSIKRSLPPPLRQWQGNVDKVLGETFDFVEDFLDAARPKLAAGVQTFMKDTTALFNLYPARITITRLAPDVAGYDPKDYSLEVEETSRDLLDVLSQKLTVEYGLPIRVKWTAPLNHDKKDWVGLYKVADNMSREVTRTSSQGRWVATNSGEYDITSAEEGLVATDIRISGSNRQDGESKDYLSGEMVFSGDKIWWTQGVFEFRYHHNGKHNVMAISQPFEVKIERFDDEDVEVDQNGLIRGAVETALLPLIRNCFDRDPEIAPSTVDERYGSLVERDEKYAKRVVYAVQHMFGIEFAPEVVKADGNVKNFAWRIYNAKKVLAPYSMSSSKGTSTPTSSRD